MKEYPKIQSIFKRDEKTRRFFEGRYSLPEFEFLKDNKWVATEKVDGTNIRVMYDYMLGSESPELLTVKFGGKTDNAQIPLLLIKRLEEIFTEDKIREVFGETPVCLYGEG